MCKWEGITETAVKVVRSYELCGFYLAPCRSPFAVRVPWNGVEEQDGWVKCTHIHKV